MDCAADAVPRGYRIGYGRVSTRHQNPGSRSDALTAAGCDEIFIDKGASGKLASLPVSTGRQETRPLRLRPEDYEKSHTKSQRGQTPGDLRRQLEYIFAGK